MKKIILTLSVLIILFHACKNEDIINTPNLISTQAVTDHTTAEKIFNDLGNIVEIGLNEISQNKSCPYYTLMNIDDSDIDTLIIDFGDINCLYYSKLRKGKIVITFTDKYRDSLAVITTTFDKYHVNNNLVQGERIVTNKGKNSNGNIWFKIEINNASVNTSNGTINWQANKTREWVQGQNTQVIDDDRYKITGTASGNGVNGNPFNVTITDSLDLDLECLPSCIIKSGTAIISPSGYANRIINYGDSICDCNIDVDINGISYPLVISN